MPKLSEIYKTEAVKLEISGVTLQAKKDMSWEAGQKMSGATDQIKAGQEIIVTLIKSWDLQDDDGKELPITLENLSKLPVKDVTQVMNFVTNMVKTEAPDEPEVVTTEISQTDQQPPIE